MLNIICHIKKRYFELKLIFDMYMCVYQTLVDRLLPQWDISKQ